jgi:hypothetical protein
MPFIGGHNHSIEKMLMGKIVQGKYVPSKAPKAFSYLTEAAAKEYVKEFAESEELWPVWNMAFPNFA